MQEFIWTYLGHVRIHYNSWWDTPESAREIIDGFYLRGAQENAQEPSGTWRRRSLPSGTRAGITDTTLRHTTWRVAEYVQRPSPERQSGLLLRLRPSQLLDSRPNPQHRPERSWRRRALLGQRSLRRSPLEW